MQGYDIVNEVETIFKDGKFDYVLSKYVDTSYWQKLLADLFPDNYVENFTDFNYSRCFTVYVNVSRTHASVGTVEFADYVRNNGLLYRVMVQISAIAPYATYQYMKYEYLHGEIKLSASRKPYTEKLALFGKEIENFLTTMNHTVLDEQLLSLPVQGIKLEHKENDVTVYDCLFGD
jgi:hypothetical protein